MLALIKTGFDFAPPDREVGVFTQSVRLGRVTPPKTLKPGKASLEFGDEKVRYDDIRCRQFIKESPL